MISRDVDGDPIIWALHNDLTFTMTALQVTDIEGSSTPVDDLRVPR